MGKFSLRSFVTKDMRNYATAKYFVLDFSCVDEQLDDFAVALQSFQMMFSSRIIVILSGCENVNEAIDHLIAIGVRNIKIAVAGTQRRSGVTVTAFNMAAWLAARGAEVCYVEMNINRHLQLLMTVFDAKKDGKHYAVDGIDCYLTNELDRDYNFIIFDCGELHTLSTVFKEADIRLLCGSILPYEVQAFHKALSACGSLSLTKIGLCVPQEFQEHCKLLFGEDIQVAEASHDLFANNVNGHIYRPLVQTYIAETKRL